MVLLRNSLGDWGAIHEQLSEFPINLITTKSSLLQKFHRPKRFRTI